MKEIPILFKGPMVREVLADYKTHTRRMPDNRMFSKARVGDILYMKETWRTLKKLDNRKPSQISHFADIEFRAGGLRFPNWSFQTDDNKTLRHGGRWRPSIFMPKWMSRARLLITGIKDEPLQDITESDALSEGIREVTKDGIVKKYCVMDLGDHSSTPWADMPSTAVGAFKVLWDSINKEPGLRWVDNPTVRDFEFERIRP